MRYISAVNLANRKAAHAAKNNTTLHPKEFKEVRVQKYINILGATPKDIKSLNESNSAPKLVPPFNFLANQPSKKSNIVANKIKYIASSHSPFNENLIDLNNSDARKKVVNDFFADPINKKAGWHPTKDRRQFRLAFNKVARENKLNMHDIGMKPEAITAKSTKGSMNISAKTDEKWVEDN